MREKAKGSFTAEAALLQGILLWIFFLVIGVYWYCHNQIWFTAAACEAAAAGSMEASWNREGTEGIIRDKISQIRENQAFSAEGLSLEEQVGKTKIGIRCSGENSAVLGGWKGRFEVEQFSEVVRPAEHIRRVNAIRKGKK